VTKCDCPRRCRYCGRARSRDTIGHYCKTKNCPWQHGYSTCRVKDESATVRALRFVQAHPKCFAGSIGEELWGHLPWAKRPAGDNGGGSLVACVAGGFMGKLRKKGLVTGYSGDYCVTDAGRRLLEG
jgi:hypothetical protein